MYSIDFNIFGIKLKLAISWFKWCNLWFKKLKWCNYTCKSNRYIMILNFFEYGMVLFILWHEASVKGTRKQGKDNNSKAHWFVDVAVDCFSVVSFGVTLLFWFCILAQVLLLSKPCIISKCFLLDHVKEKVS